VAGVDSYSEVWTAALIVGGIHGWIRPLRKLRTDARDDVSASGKPDHANLVRIDVPLHCVQTHQPHGALRVL